MLARTRPNGLCISCRSDLQNLFERGFCTAVRPLKTITQSHTKYSRPRISTRRFSRTRTLFAAEPKNDVKKSIAESKGHGLADEDRLLNLQSKAIEDLEKELGKPIEQAIEEDELAEEMLMKISALKDVQFEPETTIEGGTDPVADLRESGAPTADVVREARQIFGEGLPEGVLNEEEFKLYTRLYGEPVNETEDDEILDQYDDRSDEASPRLFSPAGDQLEYYVPLGGVSSRSANDIRRNDYAAAMEADDEDSERALSVARTVGGSIILHDEDVEEFDEFEEYQDLKAHPLTRLGRFATNPRTTFLPSEGFVRPVEKIMGDFSNKQLKEMCEKTFGGPGLPDSPLTPRSGRSRPQVSIPLEAGQHTMGEMEANAFLTAIMPPTYASIMSVLVDTRKRLGQTWLNNLLSREGGPRVLDAGSGGVGILAWREVVDAHWKAVHSSDKNPPPTPASKTVVLTGSDALRHRAADMLDNTTFVPRLPDYVNTRDKPTMDDDRPAQNRKQFDVIIASHTLFGLKEEWSRKQQVQNLWSLLSPEGGVLILIEKGIPRGFEAIAGARELLLQRHIAAVDGQTTSYTNVFEEETVYEKGTGMIIGPCTNHEKCPMYHNPGLSHGRKDFCSFQQRYIRPAFLQRILGAKDRNHDDVDFSYLSVMKGDDIRLRHISTWEQVDDPLSAPLHPAPSAMNEDHEAWMQNVQMGFESFTPDSVHEISEITRSSQPDTIPHPDGNIRSNLPAAHNLPRTIFPPIKRRGHVTIDLCTPAGRIERWTIPKSFSKQAYRDARKSGWGDLWALGAKTRIARNLRLGATAKENHEAGVAGKGRGRKERLKIKAQEMLEAREQERLDEMAEQREFMRDLDEEFDASEPNDNFDPSSPASINNNKSQSEDLLPDQKASSRSGRRRGPSPSRKLPEKYQDANPDDEQAVANIISEWEAEYKAERQHRSKNKTFKGKKGGAYAKFGKSSKEAKRMQKDVDKIPREFDV